MDQTSQTDSASGVSAAPANATGSKPLAWRPVLLAVIAVALPFALLASRFDWVCDDAFISFRYAQNLARGFGLRYNPGESPPVEGYTNFLWVLLMAVVERVGADPALWSRALSLSSAIGLLLWVGRFVQQRFGTNFALLVATLLFLASLPSVSVWSTSGLAVMPMTLCLFGVYDRLLRDPSGTALSDGVQAGLLAAVAALLRADALVYLALIFGLAGLTLLFERKRDLAHALGAACAILALCVVTHLAWRASYYGDWLPNTARVKAVASDSAERAIRHERGLFYVVSYYMTVVSAIVVPFAGLVLLRVSAVRRPVAHGLVFLLGVSAYAVLAGGDFMTFGRFLVPAMPFLALIFAAIFARLDLRFGRSTAALATLACIALSLLPAFDVHLFRKADFDRFHFRWNDDVSKRQSEFQRWTDMDKNAREWVLFGKMLEHVGKPGESIVRGGIGAIGYYSELTMYDTFGLTNLHWREVSPPFVRKSPGHDREMDYTDFLQFHPTFAGSFALVDEGVDPYAEFQGREGWQKISYSAHMIPEVYTLPPDPEFPPGKALRVLRFKNSD